jgi:ubiquinone/menaquinone biosynthesis C-methylase UbiE
LPDSSPKALTFTGERFAPEVTGAIWYEHLHRYCVAQPLAKGLSVLDAACGEGYGSFLLAETAKEVVGIDIAPEAIAHARSRYAAPNLRYEEGSCTALPLADASIDLIVSFETIEHLWEQAEMLAEFRRVLVPGGVLVISSPNQPVYSESGTHVNDFHVRELTRDELATLLGTPSASWRIRRCGPSRAVPACSARARFSC